MNDSTAAYRTREQLTKFLGIFSPHFSKPAVSFLGDMFFGVQASENVLLSEVGRSLQEDISLKKVEDRLSRNLANAGLEPGINEALLQDASRFIHSGTLIVVDPTDIQKTYAKKMPWLSPVWDGSKGAVGENLGYTACMAVACESGSHRIVPLQLRLWSTRAPGFVSDNDEVQQMIAKIADAAKRRGIYVYDRGGDGSGMFSFFISRKLDFIVRLVGDRFLVNWGHGKMPALELARQCTMRYADAVSFKSNNRIAKVTVQYGSMPVRLPFAPDTQLHLVAVRWPRSAKPMMLITTLEATQSRKALWQVVEGYITRWRVEDTIRYIKQSYRLENIRLLDYTRLKNMAAIVAAIAYFATAWLGQQLRLNVLAEHVKKVSQRMFALPEFFYYAIADGVRHLFKCHGRWHGVGPPPKGTGIRQLLLPFE